MLRLFALTARRCDRGETRLGGTELRQASPAHQRVMTSFLLLVLVAAWARRALSMVTCETGKLPLELGEWRNSLQHMDSAVVENKPVYINEGQVYVYENVFPGYTIRYINVDNLAVRTCGASAEVRQGGVGDSSLLVVLSARPAEEIRSVIDVWGTRDSPRPAPPARPRLTPVDADTLNTLKSQYLFKDLRAVGHNKLEEKIEKKHWYN